MVLCSTDFDLKEMKSIHFSPHTLLSLQKHTAGVSPRQLFAEVKQEICIRLNTKGISEI